MLNSKHAKNTSPGELLRLKYWRLAREQRLFLTRHNHLSWSKFNAAPNLNCPDLPPVLTLLTQWRPLACRELFAECSLFITRGGGGGLVCMLKMKTVHPHPFSIHCRRNVARRTVYLCEHWSIYWLYCQGCGQPFILDFDIPSPSNIFLYVKHSWYPF